MDKSISRSGTFSSSSMHKLMQKGKSGIWSVTGLKYIKQVAYEVELGKSLNVERDSRPTSWGKFLEKYTFNEKLSTDYDLISKKRFFHPTIKHWSGMPDVAKIKTVGDIKCPYSLEVFLDKIKALQDIETYKKEFPEDYYQHISNALLLQENGFEVTHFEAIIYVPYKSELSKIVEYANNYDGDQNEIAWINWAGEEGLPYINDNGKYKDLNIILFEIPQSDKDALTERVKLAVKELNSMLQPNQDTVDVTVIEHDKEVDAVLLTGETLSV